MKNQLKPISFNTYDARTATGFDEVQAPFQTFAPSAVADAQDQRRRAALSNIEPHPITLPPNLYTPEDSQSLDIRQLVTVANGTTAPVLSFTGPKGMWTIFLNYALCQSAVGASFFTPLINGQRVLPFHGNPQNNFKLDIDFVGNIFQSTPIPVQLQLQPNDVMTWLFTNNAAFPLDASVRVQGYVSGSIVRKQGRFGG